MNEDLVVALLLLLCAIICALLLAVFVGTFLVIPALVAVAHAGLVCIVCVVCLAAVVFCIGYAVHTIRSYHQVLPSGLRSEYGTR